MWPFSLKRRLQQCLVLTEDDRIVESALSVEKGYMVDHNTSEAWTLHPGSMVRKRGADKSFALVDERDAASISLNGLGPNKKALNETINIIAKEARKEAQYKIQRNQAKDKLASAFKFVLILAAVMTAMVTIAALFFSGNLSMPW